MEAIVIVGIALMVVAAWAKSAKDKARQTERTRELSSPYQATSSSASNGRPSLWAGYIDRGTANALWPSGSLGGSEYWITLKVRSSRDGLELMLPPSRMGQLRPVARIAWASIVSATPGTGSNRSSSPGDGNAVVRFTLNGGLRQGAPGSESVGTLHLYEPEGSALVRSINDRIAGANRPTITRAPSTPRVQAPPTTAPAVLPPPSTAPMFVAAPMPAPPPNSPVNAPSAPAVPVASARDEIFDLDADVPEPSAAVDDVDVESLAAFDSVDLTPTYDPSQFTPSYQQVDYTTALTSSAMDVNSTAAASDLQIPITPYAADPMDDAIFTPTAPDIVITQPTIAAPWPPPQEFVLPDSAKAPKQ
jgi:hypothetical protein